jgi:hypothetical protein
LEIFLNIGSLSIGRTPAFEAERECSIHSEPAIGLSYNGNMFGSEPKDDCPISIRPCYNIRNNMTANTIQGINLVVAFNNAVTVEDFIESYEVVSHGEGIYTEEQLRYIYDAMYDIAINNG